MAIKTSDATPPERKYRRYLIYPNRPFTGCGCLWLALLLILVGIFVVALTYRQAHPAWW